ncbi:acid phosphatase-like protein [Aaosphaeria arxii CBS 175.79]|uniref:Acid phosphatase-like protein n=1 Tax=Aaosphaeria arxii CBS 175.79 TaxID=1450172 RepID=A0A6A5Y8C8_9PLEO|nr:acid phosphatase-like protein [Aaosphaeria arxii CBS 175.79]KAF2021579.1 acid phosphatase-like protein [Aaosphaeria arxii CBS 175.79]
MLRSLALSIALAKAASAVSSSYNFDPLQHLAGIAPYFEPSDPPLDPSPPQGCHVTRASYLIRHAAIYANDFDFEEYIEPFTDKLKNSTTDWGRAGPLSFLKSWQTPIEDEDLEELTHIGELESYTLGATVRMRYPTFKAPGKVWTSTAERTEKSAQSFISGLAFGSNDTQKVSVPESEAEGADSLTPYKGCPKYSSSGGSEQSSQYKDIYTNPIIERFRNLAPGFNFTNDDIVGMQQLCGYETVIRGSSPFCDLDVFSANDWLNFEYMNDVQYFFNAGYGLDVSAAVGFPWVNATVSTLLADEAEQDLYVSFTHRELPPMVIVALGLFNNSAFTGANDPNATMPLTTQNYNRAWKSSHILPFLSNIAIEKLSCDSYGFDAGNYVRVLVNQSPQYVPGCANGPGESCSSDQFQELVQKRGELAGGFTEKCEPDYNNSTDVLTIFNSSS